MEVEVEELEVLLGPEDSEVDLRQTLRYARRKKGGRIFEIFSSQGPSEVLVASRARWDERQRALVTEEEESRRKAQDVDYKVNRNWTAVYQTVARRILSYLDNSEALKVSTKELKEQGLSPSEPSVNMEHIVRQARSEKKKKLFQISSIQGTKEIRVASMARWKEHLRMLIVLERHCLELREEIEHLTDKQEVASVMEGKMSMQKVALEDFQRQIFQELKELEEQKTKEALELVKRKHKLVNWEGDREWARMIQGMELSGAVFHCPGALENSSFGSCSSSLAHDTDEATPASSWVAQDADDAMPESSRGT